MLKPYSTILEKAFFVTLVSDQDTQLNAAHYRGRNPRLRVQKTFYLGAFDDKSFSVDPISRPLNIRLAVLVVDAVSINSDFIISDSTDLVERVLGHEAAWAGTLS